MTPEEAASQTAQELTDFMDWLRTVPDRYRPELAVMVKRDVRRWRKLIEQAMTQDERQP